VQMQTLLRFFITYALLFSTLHAIEFADMYKISLKKDEQTKFFVKYQNYKRVFTFRWTLYKNDGLVLFHAYDKKLAQNILYLNTNNQSFKVFLKTKGADFYEVPYFLVKFKEFDYKTHKAKFEVFLSDKDGQMEIEHIKKK